MPKLLLLLPDSSERLLELVKEETSLGRLPGNDIAVQYDSLSGRHARFIVKDGVCFIEDLGSTNGTFVNGAPATVVQLADGDQIQCGELVIEFSDPEAHPVDATDLPVETSEASEEAMLEEEMVEVGVHSQRPVSFVSISPLHRVPSRNYSNKPLIAAGLIGFLAIGAVVYTILNIQIPG